MSCLLTILIQVEGRVASGGLNLIIVAELSEGQPFYPVVLAVVDKELQILFDFLVYSLSGHWFEGDRKWMNSS